MIIRVVFKPNSGKLFSFRSRVLWEGVLRAAARKNRELYFSDHLGECFIFRLTISLDKLFSKIIFLSPKVFYF